MDDDKTPLENLMAGDAPLSADGAAKLEALQKTVEGLGGTVKVIRMQDLGDPAVSHKYLVEFLQALLRDLRNVKTWRNLLETMNLLFSVCVESESILQRKAAGICYQPFIHALYAGNPLDCDIVVARMILEIEEEIIPMANKKFAEERENAEKKKDPT